MNILFAAAALSQAFNVTCAGDEITKSTLGDSSKQFTREFRIDLTTGKWCVNECKKIETIFEVQPTILRLRDSRTYVAGMRMNWLETLNRETGTYDALSSTDAGSGGVSLTTMKGACRKTDFTGFPTFDTKF